MNIPTPFVIILLLLILSMVYSWVSLAPWFPTQQNDLQRIHQIAKLKPGQTFIEMGCGNGRVCLYIAQKNPEAKIIGIELAFFFYLLTKIRTALSGNKNLTVVFGNALKYDISHADVIYVFGLLQTVNGVLRKKVRKRMKKGAKIISYLFSFQEWDAKKVRTYEGLKKHHNIHVYTNS